MAGKFELFTAKNGKTRFRLKARNGEIIAVSQDYDTRATAKKGIVSIQKNAPGAEIIDTDAVAKAAAKAAAAKPAAVKKAAPKKAAPKKAAAKKAAPKKG